MSDPQYPMGGGTESVKLTESNLRPLRVAAVGDLHCTAASRGSFRPMALQAAEVADVLVLCGDLTQAGRPEEARMLAQELSNVGNLRIVGVLGNHDLEAEQPEELRRILGDAGITILDGESCQVQGVGIAGVKGFGGGFHGRILIAWGERVIKQFVQEAVNEARKLDAALQRLTTPRKLVLMHYSPIRATVVNEPAEIFPFVGSSHLEVPLNRYHVTAAFHGHAHHGTPEGRTSHGVPVYNVSDPLVQRLFGQRFRVVEVPVVPKAG